MVLLAASPQEQFTTHQIAATLLASESHLSKVLQRLVRADMVKSIRGPKGGFTIIKSSEKVTLQEIFELFEGPLTDTQCLLENTVCQGERCVLGDLLEKVNRETRTYLATTTLTDLTHIFTRQSLKQKV